MILSRYVPERSPLSLPWGVVLGMIERARAMGEDVKGAGLVEFLGEDLWAR